MRIGCVYQVHTKCLQAVSRSIGDSCWFRHLTELAGEVEVVRGSCWSSQEGGRLMRHRLTATRCLQARLTARRTLGRARVTPLGALGLQDPCLRRPLSSHGASEHLTQLRATDGKDLGGICSLGRSRRISGRLSVPHIRMVITCSPHLRWKVCLRQISRTTNGIYNEQPPR